MSTGLTLDTIDWKKILTGALMAGVGAGLTYLLEFVGTINFGDLAPVATALFGILANVLRKWITTN